MQSIFHKSYIITAIIAILMALLFIACNKDRLEMQVNTTQPTGDNYSSMYDFYQKNEVPMQTFQFNSVTGGSNTFLKGTVVTVPPNAFKTLTGDTISGIVTLEIKEIYKKSDMLLSDIGTTKYAYHTWLKSGGMFFIKALINNVAVKLATGSVITINQPFSAVPAPADSQMQAFIGVKDSSNRIGWYAADTVKLNALNYVFSLYQFTTPEDSGTWCNSDDRYFFYTFTSTTLTATPADNVDTFQTDVFLVFKTVNCMVHVYYNGSNFPYSYAPENLPFTVVAVGVKGGKLYSYFSPLPVSLTGSQTINFTLSQTTTADFKNQLQALN
jgi:hypothetical protein